MCSEGRPDAWERVASLSAVFPPIGLLSLQSQSLLRDARNRHDFPGVFVWKRRRHRAGWATNPPEGPPHERHRFPPGPPTLHTQSMEKMGRLEFTTPREAWGGEATAFTPLLANDDLLAYLGDATGIGQLSLIEAEHATAGNRSLDILAETMDGRRVSIENQYNAADHDHLTRGLAYAVATDSVALVVIAEDHREEFISVADYLNEVAVASDERSIRVWLVQVRAARRVGDDIWSPEFVVRASPNEWEGAVRREVSPRLRNLDEFYAMCDDGFADFARTTIEAWVQRDGAHESHKSRSTVALYHRSPNNQTRGSNVVQLQAPHHITICRGYIRDSSGLYDPDADPIELDEALGKHFPNLQSTAKDYYPKVDNDREGLAPFLDWLSARLNQAIEG